MPDGLLSKSVWISCINSALNFFVYFALLEDFRERVKNIFAGNWKETALDEDVPATDEELKVVEELSLAEKRRPSRRTTEVGIPTDFDTDY